MLFNVLSTWVLLFGVASARTECKGSELSMLNDFDVGTVTEKQCTHVFGDIVIRNLNNGKRLPSYWTVRELYGSLIIQNTTSLADSVNLQNLRVIDALGKPAIILTGNRGLRLAIGARLEFVRTPHRVKYYFQNNWPAFMTESEHYTLMRASADERPIFFTDNYFMTGPCNEGSYKLWTGVFSGLSFVASLALLTCACIGRSKQKEL